MTLPLMPKATAVWLVENTTLTFKQIADFCGVHLLEIQAIADGDVASNIMGLDPISGGQLTKEEILRCEKDETASLQLTQRPDIPVKKKGKSYTSMVKRQDKKNAIAWLVIKYPQLSDAQIIKLAGTTKATITAIRTNIKDMSPMDPRMLGLCSETALQQALKTAGRHLEAPQQAEEKSEKQEA
jgi:uncharacterized protein